MYFLATKTHGSALKSSKPLSAARALQVLGFAAAAQVTAWVEDATGRKAAVESLKREAGQSLLLKECRDQQITALTLTCVANDGQCSHTTEISVVDAIDRWGEDRRMNDLPVCCEVCNAPRFNEDGQPNIVVGFGELPRAN